MSGERTRRILKWIDVALNSRTASVPVCTCKLVGGVWLRGTEPCPVHRNHDTDYATRSPLREKA